MTAGTLTPPADPPIFHITHLNNLPGILTEGGLWCDAERTRRGIGSTNIGYSHIKQRRLRTRVRTAADGCLGDYVPFNFCSRSVMLYVVSRGHDDYSGGEDEVVHLVSRVSDAVGTGRPFAFTDRHAELGHALHFDDLGDLDQVPWHVMDLSQWSSVREERQAEFLVKEFFPWLAVRAVVAKSEPVAAKVADLIQGEPHRPKVAVRRQWYY